MAQYTASLPQDGQVPADIQTFYQRFYEVSDSPTASEEYVTFFTQKGTVVMRGQTMHGRDEVLNWRLGAWETTIKRSHFPKQIFTFGAGSNEYMLHGTVDFGFKDGSSKLVPWAARARLVKEGDAWKMDYYEVYI